MILMDLLRDEMYGGKSVRQPTSVSNDVIKLEAVERTAQCFIPRLRYIRMRASASRPNVQRVLSLLRRAT